MRAVNLIPADQRRGAGGLAGRSGGIVYVVAGGLDLCLAHVVHLDIRLERRGLELHRADLLGHLRELALAVGDAVDGERVDDAEPNDDEQPAGDDVDDAAGATGEAARAAALVVRNEVDGPHCGPSASESPAATARRLIGTCPAQSGVASATAPRVISSPSSWPRATSKPSRSSAGPVRIVRLIGASPRVPRRSTSPRSA